MALGLAHTAPDPAAVDRARLDLLRRACTGAGAPTLAELVSEFVDYGCERLDGLREALAGGDVDEVVRLAHGLAGSSGMIGLPALAGLATELEHRVRAEGLEGAPAVTAALVGAFPRAVRALRLAAGEVL